MLATRRYTVSKLRFPSPIETPDVENNVVHAEYFAPIGFGPKRPAVVVLHILGSDFPLSRYMAARLADRGVAALFVKLPYYGERRPPDRNGVSSKRFLSGDIERSMSAMRQGVCDVRRAVSWLKSRPDVDGTRLAVAGISLGGIVSSVAAAVDPAIQRGVFLLAGGDLSVILWEMPEGAPFRKLWLDSGRTQTRPEGLDRPVRPADLCQTVSRQARAHDRGQGRRGCSSFFDRGPLGSGGQAPDSLVRLRPLLVGRFSAAGHSPDRRFLGVALTIRPDNSAQTT